MSAAPYWSSPDGNVQLYHGDMRELLPVLGLQADLVVTDRLASLFGLLCALGNRQGHDCGDPTSTAGHVGDLSAHCSVVQYVREGRTQFSDAHLARFFAHATNGISCTLVYTMREGDGMEAETQPTCSNCNRPAKGLRRTWCRPCYLRWFKAGKPESGPPPIKNDSLARWREAPQVANTREPTALDVGTAGEHLVCADLLLDGYVAFLTDQNCAYDIAVDLGGRLVRLQVKSTRCLKPLPQRSSPSPSYQWHVRRAGKGGRRLYADGEFDLLALVALDIRTVAYVPPSLNRQTIHIRQPGSTEGKQFADYPFARALYEIGASA